MARSKQKKQKTEEFEVKKDYNPDFLAALGELAELSAKEDDFRATSFRRAIVALEGQIITAVEDIKLFKLAELTGVGKSTLEMLTEFIETGKIERLEEMRPEEKATPDQVEWFSSLTKEQAGYIQDWWDETGERKCCVGTGLPYTFEHDGKEYKVDGDVEESEYGGALHGLIFDGNVYLNGDEWFGSVSITWNASGFGDDENECSIGCGDGGDEELVEGHEDFEEACFEAFDSVTGCGLYSFAYRE
jgi:hypothetical protein